MAMAEIVLRIARIYIALSTSHAGASCTGRTSIARVAQKTCALLHEAQEAVAELLPRSGVSKDGKKARVRPSFETRLRRSSG
jgi:uncharacterized membrane-anchored protein